MVGSKDFQYEFKFEEGVVAPNSPFMCQDGMNSSFIGEPWEAPTEPSMQTVRAWDSCQDMRGQGTSFSGLCCLGHFVSS